jgi:hypothetical protein
MIPQTTSYLSIERKTFLQRTILGNAAFSGVSGLLMFLAADPFSQFLGLSNPLIMTVIGIVLLLYMPFLVWLSNQSPVPT